jgi:hypothetical protein
VTWSVTANGNVQALVPLQTPLQPTNRDPAARVAVNVAPCGCA